MTSVIRLSPYSRRNTGVTDGLAPLWDFLDSSPLEISLKSLTRSERIGAGALEKSVGRALSNRLQQITAFKLKGNHLNWFKNDMYNYIDGILIQCF